MKEEEKKPTPKYILYLLVIIFTIIFPAVVIVFGAQLLYKTNIIQRPPKEEILETEKGALKPSQLLENRAKYKNQRLTLVGRVFQAPIVCERKECPKEDPCCGCQQERNLIISDAEAVIIEESIWRLRLLGPGEKAFCQRKPNSCEYECPEWKMDGIYEIKGTFFAEPPPSGTGWRMYFEFYFEVEEKRLIRKTDITEVPKRIFKGIQELIEKLRTSGYYVLQ